MSSSATVNVDVLDINDNPPTFSLTSLTTVTQVSPMTNPCPSIALMTVMTMMTCSSSSSMISCCQFCWNGLALGSDRAPCVSDQRSFCALEGQPLRGLAVSSTHGHFSSVPVTMFTAVCCLLMHNHVAALKESVCLSVCPQENKPVGTSILKLAVTDEDSLQNGPPYQFNILSGNDGQEFVLENDGTLVANKVLRRDHATEYVLQIQVNSEYLLIYLQYSQQCSRVHSSIT